MDRAVDLGKAVRAFGGFSGLARRLDVPLTTLHGWHRRNRLPPWRAEKIIKLARSAKKDVFVDEEPAKPRRGARRKRVK